MLCRKFELISIKIEFFMNFQICSKIGQKTLYYSTGYLAKFHKIWLGENSQFLYFSLIHIHVLMLHRKFDQIWIFYEFFKLLKNLAKVPVLYIVQGHWPDFIKND